MPMLSQSLSMRSFLSLILLALSFLSGVALADPHAHGRRHDAQAVARRARADVSLHKRFDGTRFTYYDVGLGACGKTNVASDFIVALNTPQYGGGYPGPNCFKSITITYGGKTTTATIMDECPGCPYGGLDMSRGLFDFFASESVGVLYGSWWFNGAPPPSSPPPKPTWKPSSSPAWKPPISVSIGLGFGKSSPSWTPASSSSWSDPTSSSWSSSSSYSSWSSSSSKSSSMSSSSSSSQKNNSSSTAAWSSPTPGVQSPNQPQILYALNQALLGLGSIIVAAHV